MILDTDPTPAHGITRPDTDRLPADWRRQSTHVLENWLEFSVDADEYDDVLDELNNRAHEADVRQLNGGILP